MSRTHAQLRAAEAARGGGVLPALPAAVGESGVGRPSTRPSRRRWPVVLAAALVGLAAGLALQVARPWRASPDGSVSLASVSVAPGPPAAAGAEPATAGSAGLVMTPDGAFLLKLDRQLTLRPITAR